MAIANFAPIELADEQGLLAIGGDLEPESLKLAYSKGIFPWPISEDYPLAWFSPDPRGVLEYDHLHIPQSLKKVFSRGNFEVSTNQSFEAVIMNCARTKRPAQAGTWITQEIVEAYIRLYRKNLAYSIETWEKGKLVGGLYGVCIDGIVTGESMFFTSANASKVALVTLIQHLMRVGIDWLDTQMVTPVVQTLGGREIPRDEFISRLKSRPRLERGDIFPAKKRWTPTL
jgi:leucyl/phenylalanyl-tRNA--protein transferase